MNKTNNLRVDASRNTKRKKLTKSEAELRKSLMSDRAEIRTFIDFVGGKKSYFQTFPQKGKSLPPAKLTKGQLSKALVEELSELTEQRSNVSMLINESDGNGRKRANIIGIRFVFIDCDSRTLPWKKMLELPCPPYLIVKTSPGRFHAYWPVSDCTVDEFAIVQLALAKHFGSDRAVIDACRVMRVPGTINWNHEPPYRARIVHQDNRDAVTIRQLKKKLGLIFEAKSSVLTPQDSGGESALTPKARARLVERINVALHCLKADDREVWLRAGMAVHSALPVSGKALWDKWSQSSTKFNAEQQHSTWSGFKRDGGININSLFYWAGRETDAAKPATDIDLAMLFAATYAHKVRFNPQSESWYDFNGVVWVQDKLRPIIYARLLIEDLCAGNSAKKQSLNKYRCRSGLKAIVGAAELIESLHIKDEEFDPDPNLLAVRNGVVDLRTASFRAARFSDYMRRFCNVEFTVDAKCPRWTKFIKQVTSDDKQLAQSLRRALGYTLFGHAKEQVFFVPEGAGGNGKGVLLRVVNAVLGDYAQTFAPNLLTSAYSSSVNASTPALAMLKGVRMVIVTEMPNTKSFDQALLPPTEN